MKKFVLIFSLFMIAYFNGFSRDSTEAFSVTIDSISIEKSLDNPEFLFCYVTIKNLSPNEIEIRECVPYKLMQEERGWDFIFKKNGKEECSWTEKHQVDIFFGSFKVKKNKEVKKRIMIALDEMVITDSSGGKGEYTVQLELSNLESKKVEKQTVLSNIVNIQLKNEISRFSLYD